MGSSSGESGPEHTTINKLPAVADVKFNTVALRPNFCIAVDAYELAIFCDAGTPLEVLTTGWSLAPEIPSE